MLSASARRQRARLGGLAVSATHDTRELTAPARAAFEARFYAGIPADLPTEERDRRALAARRAYFARLTWLSVRARSSRRAAAQPVSRS